MVLKPCKQPAKIVYDLDRSLDEKVHSRLGIDIRRHALGSTLSFDLLEAKLWEHLNDTWEPTNAETSYTDRRSG